MAIWDIKERNDITRANEDRFSIAGSRGVFCGGFSPNDPNGENDTIDYVSISTGGNFSDFGNLTAHRGQVGTTGSNTRGVTMGGGGPDNGGDRINIIDFITIMSTGNSIDFGDLTAARRGAGVLGNQTRAIAHGGKTPGVSNIIDFVTIASTGDAADFGDQTTSAGGCVGISNPIRGVMHEGYASGATNVLSYVTIASAGDAADFGDLTAAAYDKAACSNLTRAVFAGDTPRTNVIEYITIASTGDATDFGDLAGDRQLPAGLGSGETGLFGGGRDPGYIAYVGKINICTTGNQVDYGQLILNRGDMDGTSNAHGGLDDSAVFFFGNQRPSVTYMPGSGRAVIHVNNGDYDFFNINTQGTTANFGDQRVQHQSAAGCSDLTRGVTTAERTNGSLGGDGTGKNMEYITIASTGNAADFGDMATLHLLNSACSDATRGVSQGGQSAGATAVNVMEYFTIQSLGNAADFGNLTVARARTSSFESNTRGICSNGRDFTGPSVVNTIDYITIQSTGNATDFGDSTLTRDYVSGTSSNIRGLTAGGYSPDLTNVIDYVTIASAGDATDFGDLQTAKSVMAATSNNVRAYFGGGYTDAAVAQSDFVTITTTGNGADFGDLKQAGEYYYAVSDSHGGLQS
jgi:hypothetical protein